MMLALAGCADEREEMTPRDETLEQTDGVPQLREGYTAFVQSGGADTRTYMHPDGSFDWYPYPEEKIWVIKEANDIRESVGTDLISPQKNATFYFSGHYTADTYQLLYTGEVNTDNENGQHSDKVTINKKQVQEFPNAPGRHVAIDGDCGVATAVRVESPSTEDVWYEFNDDTDIAARGGTSLQHKAHYLVFRPHVTNQDLDYCHLLRIRVEEIGDGHNIAGTYEFSFDGLNTTSSKVTGGSKMIDLYCSKRMDENGNIDETVNRHQFAFHKTGERSDDPICIMVIQPGTHKLRFTYSIAYYRRLVPGKFSVSDKKWMETSTTDNVVVVTKDMTAAQAFDAGKYTEVNHELTLQTYKYKYNMQLYHTWDAAKYYWYNNETKMVKENDNWSDSFYLDSQSFTNLTSERNGPRSNTVNYQDDNSLPDANQMTYYVRYGDIHRDEPHGTLEYTPWLLEGLTGSSEIPVVCTGGIWVKKKQYIESERSVSWNSLTGNAFDGKDLTDASVVPEANQTASMDNAPYTIKIAEDHYGIPAEKEKYFFLPDLGYFYSEHAGGTRMDYIKSYMRSVGLDGFYWTATKFPQEGISYYGFRNNAVQSWNVRSAYFLFINNRESDDTTRKTYVGLNWYDQYNHVNNHIRRDGMVGYFPRPYETDSNGDYLPWFQ